jgi:tetratricopeptide (TPR) repeat protein
MNRFQKFIITSAVVATTAFAANAQSAKVKKQISKEKDKIEAISCPRENGKCTEKQAKRMLADAKDIERADDLEKTMAGFAGSDFKMEVDTTKQGARMVDKEKLVEEFNAEHVDTLIKNADVCYNSGFYDIAAQIYSAAINYPCKKLEAKIAKIYCSMGTAYFMAGKSKEAIVAFNELIKIDEKNANAYYFMSLAKKQLSIKEKNLIKSAALHFDAKKDYRKYIALTK